MAVSTVGSVRANSVEILRASDYSSGLYRADAISVPSGSNACLLTIRRDGWSDRLGDGRAEEIGFQDPDDSRRIVTLRANRDEVVRAWVMASLDKGSTWFFAGMVGTRGGPLPQRMVGGTLKEPILGPGVETAIRICGIEGALLRIFFECLTNVRAKLDIAFLSVDSPELTPRHNSVGFVVANSNVATSASSVSSGNITPSGDNRMVIAYSTEVTIAGVGTHTLTYAGGSGTSIVDYTDSGFGGIVRLRADRFMSPATSANQASVTRSGGNADVLSCGVAAFDGVDETTPVGTPVVTETTAASISVNVSDVEADDMVNDLVIAGSTPIAPNQSNTSRWEEEPAGFDSSGSSTKTGTGTVTIGWSVPGGGAVMAGWRIIAAAPEPAAVEGSVTEASAFGATFAPAATQRVTFTTGIQAASALSGQASTVGLMSSAIEAGEAFSGRAVALGAIVEALDAGDTDAAAQAAVAALSAQVETDAQYAAIAQAAAAIQAGLAAGEAWAALAAAEAGITAGHELGATFSGDTQAAQEAALAAGTEAAALFLGAVAAFALLQAGATASDAFGASASVSQAFTGAAQLGASFTPVTGDTSQISAAAAIQAAFLGAVAASGQLAMAVDVDDAFEAVSVALSAISAGVILGATFAASSTADVSIIGAVASVRAIRRMGASVRVIRTKATIN